MDFLADTPNPPYDAVIFSSIKREYDEEYEQTAERITVPCWDSMDAIKQWKDRAAKQKGKSAWYGAYAFRMTRTEPQRMFASKGSED
ncbi:antibiotic biosynthesis monooxygenase [Bacillus siamensis]|uniref:antibiotic biosynthesis monooxygenase n=1 Tax=Bacillus siamensis TaxID=659243 RepID=UPI002DB6417D|nr:antibiotic biosynthesis monooxygenase [Bacillus siamensis]MEC3655042.1 antibiotic biosynthesis monooxygenase [Bacillus siamensis]